MSTSIGSKAEAIAGQYLEDKGYEIIEYNWRRPQCEIDIVAMKNSTIFFIEVKYRKTTNYGGGLEYITPKKLRQMQFATTNWTTFNNWNGPVSLGAIEVTGEFYKITNFISSLQG